MSVAASTPMSLAVRQLVTRLEAEGHVSSEIAHTMADFAIKAGVKVDGAAHWARWCQLHAMKLSLRAAEAEKGHGPRERASKSRLLSS